ncbi:MAG TPA: Flp family type IVb pilin [Bradyrhizobium sp.]|nr:Flp family type IVb pilin [Bradyrhizobium sp.]
MKARLSCFLMVVATALECGIIAVGIAFAIIALMNGFGYGRGPGFCSIDVLFK